MNLGSRRIRLKAVWLLLLPFFFFARPSPLLLVGGGAIALTGAAVRAWAAGYIRKDAELATGGPYAHTRNPLYLGSLLIGLGVTVAGGRWIFALLFLAFFFVVYRRTMRHEERVLEEEFGEAYRRYRTSVPLLLPRLTPYSGVGEDGTGWSGVEAAADGDGEDRFSLRRYLRNREWEAGLGILAGFAFLLAKMVWTG